MEQAMAYDEPQRHSTVMSEISRMGEISQRLEQSLHVLADRLGPVLSGETPMKALEELANPKSQSQIAEMLNNHNNLLENISVRLNSVIARLDV